MRPKTSGIAISPRARLRLAGIRLQKLVEMDAPDGMLHTELANIEAIGRAWEADLNDGRRAAPLAQAPRDGGDAAGT